MPIGRLFLASKSIGMDPQLRACNLFEEMWAEAAPMPWHGAIVKQQCADEFSRAT